MEACIRDNGLQVGIRVRYGIYNHFTPFQRHGDGNSGRGYGEEKEGTVEKIP